MTLSPLAAYQIIWGLSVPLELVGGTLFNAGPWGMALLLVCLVAAAMPSRPTWTVLAFSMRIVWWLKRLPFTWDSEVMAMLTDLIVVLHVLEAWLTVPCQQDEAILTLRMGQSMRRTMGWFYWFAGFWKINTSFLDHRYSCASIYVAQILDAYVPPKMLSSSVVEWAIRAAPLITIGAECGIGLLMLLRAYWPLPKCGAMGVVLATALHLGIDITPKPNNIASFSHQAAIRYLWFAPLGTAAALEEVGRLPTRGALYVAIGAAVLAFTVAAQQPETWAVWKAHPGMSLRTLDILAVDWHVVAHVTLSALLIRGLIIGEGHTTTLLRSKEPSRTSLLEISSGFPVAEPPASRLVHVNTVLCIGWVCGTIVFGVLEINSPNMFSNLRMQGGSNHLFGMPTSLMHAWRYKGSHAVDDDPFSGGIVRVEHSTSVYINDLYPADETPFFTTGTVEMLRRSNHSARHFNSAVARVVGPFAVPPRSEGAPFLRYTLPAFELRRLLREARAIGETFELTYTSLPGATGNELWRIHSPGRTIRLVVAVVDNNVDVVNGEDGEPANRTTTTTTCSVLANGNGSNECQNDDVAIAPFPHWDFVSRPFEATFGFLQTWNSLPILTDSGLESELHCYGS